MSSNLPSRPRLLRHHADRRTIGLLVVLSACSAMLVRGGCWLWLGPCILLTISACAAKHNHTHRTVFARRWTNRALDLWLTLLTGSSTTGIRVAHQVRHHGHNQSVEDFVRCAVVAGLPPGRALLRYVPAVVARVWSEGNGDLAGSCRRPLRRAVAIERVVLWLFIAGGTVLGGARFLIAFGLPWAAAQWFLVAMNLPQHDGRDPASRWGHSRNVTGRLANWLFLNNGYHTAHHEWPGRHWSELPALHSQHLAPHLDPAHDTPSLVRFWGDWWKERAMATSPRS